MENAEKSGKPENAGKAEKDVPKFDWVTKRSSCSLPKIFKELRIEVEADIKIRNSLRPNNSPYEFSVSEKGPDFTVLLDAAELQQSVTFTLADHAILVKDDKGNPMLEMTLNFDDRGECKLYVNGQERELWQVRRMALEDIMFRGY